MTTMLSAHKPISGNIAQIVDSEMLQQAVTNVLFGFHRNGEKNLGIAVHTMRAFRVAYHLTTLHFLYIE